MPSTPPQFRRQNDDDLLFSTPYNFLLTHFDDSQGSLNSDAMHKLRIKQCIFE